MSKVTYFNFQVNYPLDTEIIWKLYHLKHIWKLSVNVNNCEVLWDAAGVECFHQWVGYWDNPVPEYNIADFFFFVLRYNLLKQPKKSLVRGIKDNFKKAKIKNKSVWTGHEDTGSEETEAGLLVGHKLTAGQRCTPDTKAEIWQKLLFGFSGRCFILNSAGLHLELEKN